MIENQLIRYLIIGIGLYLLYVYLSNQIYVERREDIKETAVGVIEGNVEYRKEVEEIEEKEGLGDWRRRDYLTKWISKGFGYGYGSMSPAGLMPNLIGELGPPDAFQRESGGGAVWQKDSLKGIPYQRVQIRDEQIPVDKPKPHTQFLYSWYRVEVPQWKVRGLDKISKSIKYDPESKMVIARGHDLKSLAVTNWVVKHYAQGDLTVDEAVNMIGPMMLEVMEDSEGVKYRQLESEL